MEHGEDVSVFPAQYRVFVKVHGWWEMVGGVVGDLDEAASLWGEGVPGGFCGVEGGWGCVVGGVAGVFEEFLLGAADYVVLVGGWKWIAAGTGRGKLADWY